jgi:DNA-binding beta-propeller fold protein YncE
MILPVSRPLRFAQRLVALAASIVLCSLAGAQGIAFQTLSGTPGVTTPFNNTAPITFNNPHGVAVDTAGNVYVADTSNHVIRRITAAGVVSTLAGAAGSSGTADDSAGATLARFNSPQGVALNADGTRLYVADTGNHAIRVIALSAAGGSVASVGTLAGTAGTSGSSNTGTGSFNNPRGIVADTAGNLYVADTGNHLIRKIVITGPVVSTVAGLVGNTTFANGNNTVATFNTPYGVAVSADNATLYVADFGNHVIRRITGLTGTVAVATMAGTQGTAGFIDATGTAAAFRNPTGVSVDASGNVIVVDFGNNAVRQITSADAVTTIAGPTATGSATAGASGVANGTGNAVRFTGPIGVATKTVSGVNYIYVGDTNNHLIRQGAAPSNPTVGAASPATQTVNVGTNGVTFSSTVTGGWPAPTLKWQIQPGGSGAFSDITASSTYQNVTTNTLTINGVTAAMNNDKFRLVANSGSAVEGTPGTLLVNQAPTFANSSVTFTAVVGRASSFLVAATGSATISYTTSSNFGGFTLASNGSITGTPGSTAETVSGTITASNSVGTATQTVTINVVPESSAAAPVITSASSASFVAGQANNFTFTASGAPTPLIGVSGTLPQGVTYVNGLLSGTPVTTDNSPFTLTVSATNALGTATQTFTLNVTAAATAPTIGTQPNNVVANLGANATFTASATGSPSPTLRWQRQASGSGGFADLFDDSTYSGTTTGTLVVTNLQAGMTGDQYRLVATNANGTATSSVATLTVNVGTVIGTFAGQSGTSGATDATGTAARFNAPSSIAIDLSGNFYIADSANHVIRKITPGGVVTTLAGLAGSSGTADGQGSVARFSGPSAVAVNTVGTVFVADTFNHTIRSITPDGNVSTIAGLAGNNGTTNGTGSAARFSFPSGIAADSSGNVYVSDSANHTIRRIQSFTEVTTYAGTPGIAGSSDGTGAAARFNYPGNITLDSAGNLYVADSLNHTIRRINTSGSVVTIAGIAGVAGSLDANGTASSFNRPTGVAIDNGGNVYVADTNNHLLRRISSGGTVTTLAGTAGVSGTTDGAGGQALFNQPFALTVDTNGNLYIADTRNHSIRRSGTTSAPSITTQPQNRVVPAGGSTTFTVAATGTPAPSLQWQRQAAGTSGFTNLANGSGYSGVNTTTLTVSNVLNVSSGDQYRVIVSNGVNPQAISEAATLTIGEPPVITSAASTTVRASDALNFTFTASGTPTSTFTATPLPEWATVSSAGVLSGTPPVGAQGTYTFTVTANNGALTTQEFTLTVTPAIVAPTISAQPQTASVNQGQSATFSVTASGTAPLTYQWRRNGAPINGATSSSYTVGNAQPSAAGTYDVIITNAGGGLTSNGAQLVVNTIPTFTQQPQTQIALAGSTVTFTAGVTGGSSFNYQWRKNGQAIAGATGGTLTINGVTGADAGNYDVLVSNALGLVGSSLAQLTVVTTPTAPLITAQPASRTTVIGGSTSLSVSASGAPAVTYQWRKNGANIINATGPTLAFSSTQPADGGTYDVVVTNSAGFVVSKAANLRVLPRSYAGIYFGTFSGNLGNFALYVREDNTGVFLGYLPGSTAAVMSLNVEIRDDGTFTFSQGNIASAAVTLAAVTVSGSIGNDGALSGSITGGANASLGGNRLSDTGPTQSVAGFYRAGVANGSTSVYTIAGSNALAMVVAQSATTFDGGLGAVSANGQITLTTTRSVLTQTVDASGNVSGSTTGAVVGTLSGGSDASLARQRLVNISSRARVAGGDSVAIAGFVISGEQSKPVLIRAVGPTLGTAPFNVAGALATPRLELMSAQTVLASNAGIAANRTAIDAAGVQAGAFALGASGADAAILTTLAPGNYTAVVSSTNNSAGVALIEVYDLSGATPGQKLLNISTRASAGSSENTLIAGFVVPAGSAKRVLIRGIGPGLGQFGVGGLLAQPTLTLLSGSNTVAQNTNWSTSADAATITSTSVQVGGFPLVNGDSALIATLAPGNYTAQVVGAGGATGVALIEVYELP